MKFKIYHIIVFVLLSLSCTCISAQDTTYARHIIDTLTSAKFNGRGYTKNGLKYAQRFLEKEFEKIGLKPMNAKSFLQKLSFPVNTFPGDLSVAINDMALRPGYDYIVEANSRSQQGNFSIEKTDSTHFINHQNKFSLKLVDKLTWRVSKTVADSTGIIVLKSSLQTEPTTISLKLQNKFIERFSTANICGMVKGTSVPDSFIIFSAHYDHLGGMGKDVFFPGANDNASGISLLLGLAKWFAENPQRYSIGFILFTGEEAGLVGSEHFTKNPLVPLNSIRFLINLDLTGTGEEGITVVNATEYEKEFALLNEINNKKNLLKEIKLRGKAKNSDHYWFSENGVHSFFIYTMGGIKAYHDVHDVSSTLPNNEYGDLFLLLKLFVKEDLK